jgi:DNA-binding SARP family transcriptional activator
VNASHSQHESRIRLHLLGSVDLIRPDGVSLATVLAQPKRLALLARLAHTPGTFQRRDILLNLFWSDFEQERARAALRRALYFLRQALGETVIVARGDEELAANAAAIWCDAAEFRAAMADRRYADAAELYRGDLLPGFFIPDASEFERWLDETRLQLRREAAKAATELSNRAEAAGDLDEAARRAQSWLELDAQSEPAFRRVAMLLHARGDRAGMARAYDEWGQRLKTEYGIEPSGETQAMLEELLSQPRDAARRTAPPDLRPSTQNAQPLISPSFPPERRRTRRSRLLLAAAVAAVAVVSAGAISLLGRPFPRAERVLVVTFQNQTGRPELDPVGRIAADWIARGAMETRAIDVVSHAWIGQASASSPESSLRDMADNARTGTAVTGAYYLEQGAVRFEAQITDVRGGQILHALEPVRVPVDSALQGVDLLRQRIAGALAARFQTTGLSEVARRVRPPTYAAYQAYVRGMELFQQQAEPVLAIREFDRAAALDPTFHTPKLFAALMYYNSNNFARMDSVLSSLAATRADLELPDRILLHNLQAVLAGDRESARLALRQLDEVAPGSGLGGQVSLAITTNRPREAIRALQRIEVEHGLLSKWVGRWWHHATAMHMLGDHRRELRVAREGRTHYPDQLLLMENRALAALGRIEELDSLLRQPPATPGVARRYTRADVWRNGAIELRAHGHQAAAVRFLNEALAWYGAQPETDQPRLVPMLAVTLYEAGKWEGARVYFAELSARAPRNPEYLGRLGTIAARQGKPEAARQMAESLASAPFPYSRGVPTLWRARIAAQLGEKDQAVMLLRQAISEGQGYGLWLHTDVDLDPLRGHREFRAMLRPRD